MQWELLTSWSHRLRAGCLAAWRRRRELLFNSSYNKSLGGIPLRLMQCSAHTAEAWLMMMFISPLPSKHQGGRGGLYTASTWFNPAKTGHLVREKTLLCKTTKITVHCPRKRVIYLKHLQKTSYKNKSMHSPWGRFKSWLHNVKQCQWTSKTLWKYPQ